ncbi:hypothetical protein CDAR_478071 [Caerostris darwini]|uniref:Uncharacterized protein n=1 Tax=Caerostris darwini TaxID=1538125 RepID=A0AAV4Q0H8_9ARAC|nr:hypothetical protein CDAR_478071 [Caerostris darwini]
MRPDNPEDNPDVSFLPFINLFQSGKSPGANGDHGTNSKLIRFAPFCFHNGKGDLVTRLGNVKKTPIAFGGESPDIFGEEPFNKRWIIFVHDCAKNWITVFRRHLGTRTVFFAQL